MDKLTSVLGFSTCLGMSCPGWQWHRTGSRWSPLPVALCDVTWDSSRTVVVIKLRRTSALKFVTATTFLGNVGFWFGLCVLGLHFFQAMGVEIVQFFLIDTMEAKSKQWCGDFKQPNLAQKLLRVPKKAFERCQMIQSIIEGCFHILPINSVQLSFVLLWYYCMWSYASSSLNNNTSFEQKNKQSSYDFLSSCD